jgi:hypothetical protein
MKLPLETWYILRDMAVTGEHLQARFVPDYFDADVVNPVLIICVDRPVNVADAKEKFSRFDPEPLVEIDVSAQKVALWSEYDDEPVIILGRSVTSERAAYLPADLLHVIEQLNCQLESSQSQVVELRARLQVSQDFVAELLHRAGAKKALTSRSTSAIDVQIQVLERVLGKLRDV